jgi:Biopolymer transport proteins
MFMRFLILCAVFVLAASQGHADEVTRETILGTFERGGKIMWAILLASVIGCAFIAERLLVIRRGAQIPKRLMADLRDAMVSGGVSAGLQVVEGDRSAMGRVMQSLLSRSGATRRELETTVDEEGSRILYDLRANLRPIGVVASISPLLGLLGTVFGLIAAFRSAAELGMDDPRNFAAGIYEALYTTAFGLVVAIPLLIIYHMMRNHADNIMREVEERALAFISAASNRAERAGARRQATRSAPPARESERVTEQERHSEPEHVADPEHVDEPESADEPESPSAVAEEGERADSDETSVDDE